MLLAAGSPLCWLKAVSDGADIRIYWNDKDSVLDEVFEECDEGLFLCLVQSIIERRRELVSIARDHLPGNAFGAEHFAKGTVLDLEAMTIAESLEGIGQKIDREYFHLNNRSVFDHAHASRQTLQRLFDAGFTNVDCPIRGNVTLIDALNCTKYGPGQSGQIVQQYHEICLWLHERGISLSECSQCSICSRRHVLPIHQLSYRIGHLRTWRRCEDHQKQALARLAFGERYMHCKDSCRCRCAADGCTPSVIFLKKFTLERRLRHWTMNEHLNWLYKISTLIEDPEAIDIFLKPMIRMFVFESLGLRHLCCRPHLNILPMLPPVEENEAKELEEEDRFLAEEFNTLLPKALQEWEETTLSFLSFLTEFYDRNIRPRKKQDDEGHRRDLQNLGVRIEEEPDSEDESEVPEDGDRDDEGGDDSVGEDGL